MSNIYATTTTGTIPELYISTLSTNPVSAFAFASLKPKKVIFNPPATIVYWNDGTKTVVKCKDGTLFDEWTGLAMATSKRIYGDKFKSVFKKWCKDEYTPTEPMIFVNIEDSLEAATKAFRRKFLEIKHKYGRK